MGILIRLDLVKNNKELNVKVLNDNGSTDSVHRKSDVLANFNVTINNEENEKESEIIVQSAKSSDVDSTRENTENVSGPEVESVRSGRRESTTGGDNCVEILENNDCGIVLKSVSGASFEPTVEAESEETLEEYFVVEKIIGNRFNPLTNQHEFLLKLKDCQPVNTRWKPVINTKTNSLPEEDGLLYVQKSKSLTSLKHKMKPRYSMSRQPENQTTDWCTQKNPQTEPVLQIETQLEGNAGRTQSCEPSSNVCNVSDGFCENPPRDLIPPINDLSLEADSIQSVNDISIKCEPIIEDGGDDVMYPPDVEPIFEKNSIPTNGDESANSSIQEETKPCLAYLGSNISNNFMCNLCGRSFSGIQYLRKHEKIHSKARVFTCSVCSYAFSNLYLLSAHEREAHGIQHVPKRRGCPPGPRKRIFEAQFQPQVRLPSFPNPLQPQIRVSSFAKSFEPPVPSVDKPFKCQLCVRTFRNEQALALHEGVHNDGRLFPCNVCDRVFTYLHALKNHERIHSNIKPVPCSYCGKLFTMESRRKLHERKHRIDFKTQKFDKTVHVTSDSRSRDEGERPYCCRYCPKAFRLKHTLVVHTRIHTGEKPFACPMCDYRSSQKISLDCHMRKHEKSWMPGITF